MKKKLYVHLKNGVFTHITGYNLEKVKKESEKLYPNRKWSISYIVKKPCPFNSSILTDHFEEIYSN